MCRDHTDNLLPRRRCQTLSGVVSMVTAVSVSGKLKPTLAFMSGKLRIKGDMTLAIKLEKLMSRMNKAKL